MASLTVVPIFLPPVAFDPPNPTSGIVYPVGINDGELIVPAVPLAIWLVKFTLLKYGPELVPENDMLLASVVLTFLEAIET